MDTDSRGRLSLGLDAAYCAAAAAVAVAAPTAIASVLGISPKLVRSAGVATIGWAGLLAVLARRGRAVGTVGVANAAAASALLVSSTRAARPAGRALLSAVGIEVAAFAGSQLAAA